MLTLKNTYSYFLGAFIMTSSGISAASQQKAVLKPIQFNEVQLEDNFFKPRIDIQKKVLLPFALEKTIPAVENLRKTAAYLKGDKESLPFAHRFIASDLYKVMEGASYLLMLEPDPELEARMDEIISYIGGAQEPSGYLYESHTTGVWKKHEQWGAAGMGDRPYSWVIHSHELYNMGHMYEGAVAYYLATGKKQWLDIAEKNAKHINHVFFEGDPDFNDGKPVNQAPGHQEIELALIKLYRTTQNPLYLEMARKFIDIRGVTFIPSGTDGCMAPSYAQQHLPVRQQTTAVGHAVRAGYMYAAMAELASLTADKTLIPALDSIWHDIVDRKMHITGGLGAVHGIEGFGGEYDLPNKQAYNETCAAVANVLFNHRMFLLHQEARYLDVAEIALYNNVLACVNLEGDRFFYVNPLEADGKSPFNVGTNGRGEWFYAACCPTNMARLIPQIQGLTYAYDSDQIYCGFYMGCDTRIPLKKQQVSIQQRTDYPFDEQIRFTITPEKNNQSFTFNLRIPEWTGKHFVPGELYSFINEPTQKPVVRVNGKIWEKEAKNGFVSINRKWKKGDRVELFLPMPVQFSKALPQVKADIDRIAVSRGPLLYCAEAADNKTSVLKTTLSEKSASGAVVSRFESGKMKGIPRIELDGTYHPTPDTLEAVRIRLIPYYSWCNRGSGEMECWFPESASSIDFGTPIDSKFKAIKSSHCFASDCDEAMVDGIIPKNSADENIRRWTSYPQTGREQRIELILKKPIDLQSFSVYWFDDAKGVRLPTSWYLEYRDGEEWKPFPLYATDAYSTYKDRFNMIHPASNIHTDQFRMIIHPQSEYAVGILEVVLEENK